MKNYLVVIGLLFLFSFQLKAQKTDITENIREARIDSLLNVIIFGDDELSSLFDVKKNYQFLYFRTNYDSRTFFAGREIGLDQYNQSGQIFYLHSKGLFAGVSGSWYSQLDPGYRTTVLTLGFGKSLKKAKFFRYRLSYDYYLFNNDDPDFEPLYTSGLTAGITLKSKNLGTRFNSTFLLGKETGNQLTWDAYAYLNLIKFKNYDKIRLEPQVSLYFGSEIAELQLNEVLIDPDTNIEYTSYYKDVFGLMNIQLQLPLSITLKNFDIEAAYLYNIPQTSSDTFSYPENSFFRFSIGYIINL